MLPPPVAMPEILPHKNECGISGKSAKDAHRIHPLSGAVAPALEGLRRQGYEPPMSVYRRAQKKTGFLRPVKSLDFIYIGSGRRALACLGFKRFSPFRSWRFARRTTSDTVSRFGESSGL
jgi:hypothetical protein